MEAPNLNKNSNLSLEQIEKSVDEAWRNRAEQHEHSQNWAMQVLEQLKTFEQSPLQQLLIQRCWLIKAYALIKDGLFRDSLVMLQDVLPMLKRLNIEQWLVVGHGLLGLSYIQLGIRGLAVEQLRHQHHLAAKIGDDEQRSSALHNLGWLLMNQKDYAKAATYIEESIVYKGQNETVWLEFIQQSNLCECYIRLGRFGDAKPLLVKTLQLSVDKEHRLAEAIGMQRYGMFYEAVEDYDKSLKSYSCSLKIAREVNSEFTMSITMFHLGKLQMRLKKYKQAEWILHEAVRLCQKMGNLHLELECYECLAELNKIQNRFESALLSFERFYQLKEQINLQENEQRVRELEVQYQTEINEQRAARLYSQNLLLERKVAKRTAQLEVLLEREKRLTDDLHEALERETAVSTLKSHIITTVSHEFRTPLTVINNSADMLYKHHGKLPEVKREQIYQRIRESIFYLSHLLDSTKLVDKAKSRNVMPILSVQGVLGVYQEVAENVLRRFSGANNLKIIDYLDDNFATTTDTYLLSEIVHYIVDNALKFSLPEQPVAIEPVLQRSNNLFLLQVHDQGVGIKEFERQRLFELFYRGENGSYRQGLGIGLYLAHEFAQLIGVSLLMTSRGENEGCTVTVCIPLLSPEDEEDV